MKKFYFAAMLLSAMFSVSSAIRAQVQLPNAPASEVLVDGKTYTFLCYSNLSSLMSRTSWDGAVYTHGTEASHLSFTAQRNSDNETWSFYYDETTEEIGDNEEPITIVTRYYLNIPDGTANLNINATERTDWSIASGQVEGFYLMKSAEGNNIQTLGYNLHMNAGNEFVVASCVGNSFYPDFYGGVLKDEYGDDVYLNPDDPTDDRLVMADSSSCYWAFVSEDNLNEYLTKASGFNSLLSFFKKYLIDESYADYAEGFTSSYNAGLALYNGVEFFEDDVVALNDMLKAKASLYEEIEKALLVEDADAVLQAAIVNAEKAFASLTDTEAVTSAANTLIKAVSDFNYGTGVLTSLGQNMSFEDLSSQNGNTTTGVQGAPTGWNVFINGKQVTSTEEVRSAGVTAWHGINGDGSGEVKDGAYIFGIWNSSIPDYEISQTIEGLENGTYTVTAGLMVGANGNGSRRTTQRLFGNLNSTYFASYSDYNHELLDKSEVYGFQDNIEQTTDTELLPISVRAYVYDGTLTFGIRTDANIAAANRVSGNGAGGDGWFKTDNFTIHKEGFFVEDALAVLDFYKENLYSVADDINIKMSPTTRTAVDDAMAKANSIDGSSSIDDINAAILAVKDIIADAYTSAQDYQKLADAISVAYENLEKYDAKAGAGEYSDVIMEIEDKWNNQEYDSEDEIDDAIRQLATALQECIESDTIEPGSDLTEYIKNHSFEDWASSQNNDTSGGVENVPNGWNLIINGTEVKTSAEIRSAGLGNWCAINRGDDINVEYDGQIYEHQYTDGEHLWGIWADNVPTIELYQVLNLPAGVYKLSVDMVVQHDWAGNNITTQRLFANEAVQMWARDTDYGENFTQDMLDAQVLQQYNTNEELTYFSYAGNDNDASYEYTSLAHPLSVTFRVGEEGKARIGIRTNNVDMTGTAHPHASAGWFKIDNFRLSCVSVGLVDAPQLPDAISQIKTNKTDDIIYDLTGRKVTVPKRGIYIQNGNKFIVK